MGKTALAVLVLLAAGATLPADAPLAQVTVRFRNAGSQPVYIEATVGDGIQWPYPTLSGASLCGEGCDCFAPAPPLPRVRVVPPGASIEASWDGRYFEGGSCRATDGREECRCALLKRAAPGRYEARVVGARAYRAEPPAAGSEYLEGAELDPARGRCQAVAAFELGVTARTVEATLTCEPARP